MPRRTHPMPSSLRTSILAATRRLLDKRAFDRITVADILGESGVSRASFYFYFASKHEVLAELVRETIEQGHRTSRWWLEHDARNDPGPAIRRSISDGARLWTEQAPVLRAIVENWRTDPILTRMWLDQMTEFADATTPRIEEIRTACAVGEPPVDAHVLAITLTWLGERLFYLAALGIEPLNDPQTLIDTLTHIWLSSIHGRR